MAWNDATRVPTPHRLSSWARIAAATSSRLPRPPAHNTGRSCQPTLGSIRSGKAGPGGACSSPGSVTSSCAPVSSCSDRLSTSVRAPAHAPSRIAGSNQFLRPRAVAWSFCPCRSCRVAQRLDPPAPHECPDRRRVLVGRPDRSQSSRPGDSDAVRSFRDVARRGNRGDRQVCPCPSFLGGQRRRGLDGGGVPPAER